VLPFLAQPKRSKLRASDLDRHHTVELLRQHAGEGRLTTEELEDRIEQAFHARTLGELATITADLPVDPRSMPTASRAIASMRGSGRVRSVAKLVRSIRRAAVVDLVCILVWLLSGHGYFWPRWVILATAIPVVIRAWRYAERRYFPGGAPDPSR